ncbi:hypothetical protein NAC44_20185 [Allorhizobium sp. BGMRC 0089]|uniref:hypothetical protein n=1 Tax=Allorhizobium sonneratiae TaxID=2934936 RepID=UPI0020340A89|nr:hypothetical protein [Allorhizobium sonneratiae]MCM2294651.1 hypothetical protein [Allorhizobium sonneratiae]
MISTKFSVVLVAIMLASAPSIAMANTPCKGSAAAHLTAIADHVQQSIIKGDFPSTENAIVDDAVFNAVVTLQRPRPNRDAALKTAGLLLQAMTRHCRN